MVNSVGHENMAYKRGQPGLNCAAVVAQSAHSRKILRGIQQVLQFPHTVQKQAPELWVTGVCPVRAQAGSLKVIHRVGPFVSSEGKTRAQSELSGSGFQQFAPFSRSSAVTSLSLPTRWYTPWCCAPTLHCGAPVGQVMHLQSWIYETRGSWLRVP